MPLSGPMTAVLILPSGMVAHPLEEGEDRQWVIGRADDCDIVIDDPSVSRRHAVLHGGPPYELVDLGSENGTMIELAPEPTATKNAATVKLAHKRIRQGERAELELYLQAHLGRVVMMIQPGTGTHDQPGPHGGDWQAPAPASATPLPASVVVVSAPMQRVYWLAERFAQGMISILLLGETGVGKEVLAEHIHRASPRRNGPFVRLNCASFRGELLESELFGHEKGAFTGANATKPGLVEVADGGTLLLDEVGETPPEVQARLLRFLEDRKAQRIGATTTRQVDVRIISATNRNLPEEIAAGRFREDLYFRLNGVAIEIPPLRDRRDEIGPLADHFMRTHAAVLGEKPRPIEAAAKAKLASLPLPGNARELRNLIERALLLAEPGKPLTAENLMLPVAPTSSSGPVAVVAPAPDTQPPADGDDEKARIIAALEECGGNQTRAATKLGMTRRALIVRLEKYGITRPRG